MEEYSEWVAADRDYYSKPRAERVGKPPLMPELPSDQDYIDAGRLPAKEAA